jgi:hypothetical protein
VAMWLKQRQASQKSEEERLSLEEHTTIEAPGNREFYTDVAI